MNKSRGRSAKRFFVPVIPANRTLSFDNHFTII